MTQSIASLEHQPALNPEICRRARLARDPRFDGLFFIGVRTTGIYCRPICPARSPAEKNVSYYPTAAQAAAEGYRPCLRCRPESAPQSPAWLGTSTTVRRALKLIDEGALNRSGLPALASRLGIGERYLRKLFERELGLSPQAVALNQRLLFAKKLLAETQLPLTDVAYAAGFGSVRRFNSAIREHFRLTPGELRRRKASADPATSLIIELQYRPPYDWDGVLAYFRRHAIEGMEWVEGSTYRRRLGRSDGGGEMVVRHLDQRRALGLELSQTTVRHLMPLVARVRRMFDLDANPGIIGDVLGRDPQLAPLLAEWPGIRAPGSWSMYESSIRAVVGQQISTEAARGVCARLASACTRAGEIMEFPRPAELATLADSHFPMPASRRRTLQTLAAGCIDREDELDLASLETLRGIGPWTLAMVGMRGAGDPDAFPLGDLGVVKAWEKLDSKETLKSRSNQWRPWRAYAANLLWRSLSL